MNTKAAASSQIFKTAAFEIDNSGVTLVCTGLVHTVGEPGANVSFGVASQGSAFGSHHIHALDLPSRVFM